MWSSDFNNSQTFEGGFLDDSRRGGPDQKERRIQTIVPVMIGILNKIPSTEEIKLWDIPVRMFTLLGIVRSVEETATKISYDVEDETGTITALKWLEADKKPSDRIMQVNTYVHITGLLREQSDKRHILILRMWPMKDLSELTSHILEVTFATLKAKSMVQSTVEAVKQITNVTKSEEESVSYGMTPNQCLIYKIIHEKNETDTGIERSKIKATVPQSLLREVDNILDFLVSEGHIYTTSTDDHFKTT